MSTWADKLITDFKITTGDGKVYKPLSLYLTYNLRYDFNIAKFNFKGVRGTLVKRGESQGEVMNINIVFQGEDTLDNMFAFKESSKNKKAWTINHPFYGNLYVQPLSLAYDNGKLNQTVITGEVMETLKDNGSSVKNNYPEAIKGGADTGNTLATDTVVMEVPEPKPNFFAQLTKNSRNYYNLVTGKIAPGSANAIAYANYYNQVTNALQTTAYDDVSGTLGYIQSLISAPAYFEDTVVNRQALLQNQLDYLSGTVDDILGMYVTPTFALKKIYENNAATIINAMCVTAVTNITTDYDYRPDILSVINKLVAAHNGYLSRLNDLQTSTGGDIDSYIPNSVLINAISQLTTVTVFYLYTLAQDALQQRVHTLPFNSNVILVAFELYPDKNADVAAQTIIANNNISTKECLVIEKGRKILYYV